MVSITFKRTCAYNRFDFMFTTSLSWIYISSIESKAHRITVYHSLHEHKITTLLNGINPL